MSIAVIYKSLLGTTQQYAKWLAEDLSADIFYFNKTGTAGVPTKDTLQPIRDLVQTLTH